MLFSTSNPSRLSPRTLLTLLAFLVTAALSLAPRCARADEPQAPVSAAEVPPAETPAPAARPDGKGFQLTLSTGMLFGGNAWISLGATAQGLYHHGALRIGGTGEADVGLMWIGNGTRLGEGALLGAGVRSGWLAADFLAEGGAFQYFGVGGSTCGWSEDPTCSPTPGHTATVGYAGARVNLALIKPPAAGSHLRFLPALPVLARHELGTTGDPSERHGMEFGIAIGGGFDVF